MKTMFTPRKSHSTSCAECARLGEAWRADEERILADGQTIARLTGLLRRLRTTVNQPPAHWSAEERLSFIALLAQVDAALDAEG